MKYLMSLLVLIASTQVMASEYQCQVLYAKETTNEYGAPKVVATSQSKEFTLRPGTMIDPGTNQTVELKIDGKQVKVAALAIATQESDSRSYVARAKVVDITVYMEMEDSDSKGQLVFEGMTRALVDAEYVSSLSIKRVNTATATNWDAPVYYHSLRLECRQ